MSYSNKTTGNITIIKPTSDFSLISNYAIHDKELSHIAFRILCYFASKPSYWDIKKEYALEEIKTSSDTYSKAMGELTSKGYIVEEKKSKGKAKGFDYFYTINTAIVDPKKPPLERIRDPKNSAIRDRKKPCVENVVISSNEDKKPSDSDSYTRQENLGSIYNTISSNTIDNTIKEKIYKKESEVNMSYESIVKVMRDRLVYSGKVENLIKEFGIEEVNKHLRYLDYFDLDNKHESYKKNLTFAFLESLRNNLPEPQALKKINNLNLEKERTEKLKPIKEYFNIKSKSNIDTVTYLFKKLVSMKENYKTNLNSFQKELINLTNNNRKILRQDELSLKEKTKLIEDSVKSYYKQRTQIITDCIFLKDYIDILTLVQIILGGNQISLQTLKLVSINNLDKEIQKLKIFILTTSQDNLEECKEWTNLQEG